MPDIALFAGAAAFIAGLSKFAIDTYKARHSAPTISVSVGNQSIQVPSSYTPQQVAALVTVLKDQAASEQAAK